VAYPGDLKSNFQKRKKGREEKGKKKDEGYVIPSSEPTRGRGGEKGSRRLKHAHPSNH